MKKRPKITDAEKLSIAYSVLVDYEFQTDVAKAYRLSASRVNAIVKSVKDDKDIFTKLKEKAFSRQNRTAIIKQ